MKALTDSSTGRLYLVLPMNHEDLLPSLSKTNDHFLPLLNKQECPR
jgi:hypothetical protein